jgi:hypothetical protein
MWVLHLGLNMHIKLPKSPMGYIKTNLNMDITFKANYPYTFEIPTRVFIFTN